MLDAATRRARRRSSSVLAIGAHADDIEIGCGGTLLRLAEQLSRRRGALGRAQRATAARADEARASAAEFLRGFADAAVVLERFRDGFFPYDGARGQGVLRGARRPRSPRT